MLVGLALGVVRALLLGRLVHLPLLQITIGDRRPLLKPGPRAASAPQPLLGHHEWAEAL
ncbi:hypothetical protein [Streptomyces sp. NBC_01306]|uniref:hypothetical protein n=1 Tax=Streptomyces sp. NBC_01306 TaxID=2903819 RepID=UPI0022576F25|nr:hypothetical protein [Streptomyces sp. NBC_01306]MCX4728652.1 hypothetical protein [Streptomyces sp. NBC_01306]